MTAPVLGPPMDVKTAPPPMAPSRRRLRLILNLAGALPALLLVLYSVKVGLMLGHDGDGRARFDAEAYDDAAGEFAANRSINIFESWVAAFDEGTAHHGEGKYDDAIADYATALEDVPVEEECTVRINLALAHESLGDAAIEMPDRKAALEAWQAGVDVLAKGKCPADSGRGKDQTADAAAVDERLRMKIEEQQPEEQQQQQQNQQQQQQQNQQEQDDKEERLEQRNQRGSTERRDSEQRDGDIDYGDGQQW